MLISIVASILILHRAFIFVVEVVYFAAAISEMNEG
jgi:hypothetical protein